MKKNTIRNHLSQEFIQEQIQSRAYELYIEKGCSEGQDLDNWLQAEAEIALLLDMAGKP